MNSRKYNARPPPTDLGKARRALGQAILAAVKAGASDSDVADARAILFSGAGLDELDAARAKLERRAF